MSRRLTTNAEVHLLSKYAKLCKKGIVEIGVFDGETTRAISKHACCPIYGIDPIIPDSMDFNLVGSKEAILKNMKNYKNFLFFKDYSFNVVKTFNHDFDFIFIDGDHTYEAVKKDFFDWFPLLQKDGYIAFHDSESATSADILMENISMFQGIVGCIQIVEEIKNKRYFSDQIKWIEKTDTINIFQKI